MTKISIAPDDRVFVLTGAGISARAGCLPFARRTGCGGHSIEDVCTTGGVEAESCAGVGVLLGASSDGAKAEPNPAHVALAELEARLGERFFLCTQNVDDLHERAGSVRLVHMHGELTKARCERECGRPPVEDRKVYKSLDEVGRCACGGRLRPHIVFFGEIPLEMERIQDEIQKATLMVVVGTSGSVYPAANFVHWARQRGARTVYVGPEAP